MFKNNDEAIKEIQCYGYFINEARKHFEKNNFMDASIYLENAVRSLRELERMKTCEGNDKVLLVGTILTGRNSNRWH